MSTRMRSCSTTQSSRSETPCIFSLSQYTCRTMLLLHDQLTGLQAIRRQAHDYRELRPCLPRRGRDCRRRHHSGDRPDHRRSTSEQGTVTGYPGGTHRSQRTRSQQPCSTGQVQARRLVEAGSVMHQSSWGQLDYREFARSLSSCVF